MLAELGGEKEEEEKKKEPVDSDKRTSGERVSAARIKVRFWNHSSTPRLLALQNDLLLRIVFAGFVLLFFHFPL